MPKQDKIIVAEHVLEIRHEASGNFLDVRGRIADYFKKESLFPHWQIDNNVINFRDKADKIEKEGAFVGYKSFGYVVLDSPTMNYFPDKANLFIKKLMKFKEYHPENFLRFGVRSKFFVPTQLSFEDINKSMLAGIFSEKFLKLIGGNQTDQQFILELKEKGFDIRILGGPLHKDEVKNYMLFDSKEFSKTGIFLDLDFYQTHSLNESNFASLINDSVSLTWNKAEQIVSGLGF